MGRRWWAAGVALLVGLVALVSAGPDPTRAPPGVAVPTTTAGEFTHPVAPPTGEEPVPDLSAAVARAVEVAAGVDLGLAVVDLVTGAAAGHNADTPFRTASLSKLMVAVDVLSSDEVPSDDLERLSQALSLSDDDAMSALWSLHDGVGAIDRLAVRLGLTATRAPADPSQWGEVEMSANDIVRLYRHIATDLPDTDRDFIVKALSTASPTAQDGFDQVYGLLAAGVDAYAKQGWMWFLPADFYLHSSGVVADRYAVAVLSTRTGVAEQDAKDHLTAVTRALLAGLTATG